MNMCVFKNETILKSVIRLKFKKISLLYLCVSLHKMTNLNIK